MRRALKRVKELKSNRQEVSTKVAEIMQKKGLEGGISSGDGFKRQQEGGGTVKGGERESE